MWWIQKNDKVIDFHFEPPHVCQSFDDYVCKLKNGIPNHNAPAIPQICCCTILIDSTRIILTNKTEIKISDIKCVLFNSGFFGNWFPFPILFNNKTQNYWLNHFENMLDTKLKIIVDYDHTHIVVILLNDGTQYIFVIPNKTEMMKFCNKISTKKDGAQIGKFLLGSKCFNLYQKVVFTRRQMLKGVSMWYKNDEVFQNQFEFDFLLYLVIRYATLNYILKLPKL